jgi:hypothetical protein
VERLRPERGAKSPSESERGWGPASAEEWEYPEQVGYRLPRENAGCKLLENSDLGARESQALIVSRDGPRNSVIARRKVKRMSESVELDLCPFICSDH